MAEDEITFRMLDGDVPNPDYDRRHKYGLEGIPTFKAGTRFRLEVRPYVAADREDVTPGIETAETRIRWGRTDLLGGARREAGGEWRFNAKGVVGKLVEASHAVPPLGYEEERDAMGLAEDDDGVLARLMWEDAETKPLLLAAMAAVVARRREARAKTEPAVDEASPAP